MSAPSSALIASNTVSRQHWGVHPSLDGHVVPKPLRQALEIKRSCLVKLRDKSVGCLGFRRDDPPIDGEEGIGRAKAVRLLPSVI
jgi:hypothetical protein